MNKSLLLTVITLLLAVSNVPAATRYVWQNSPTPGQGYTNWATAAHVIQDAVDAAGAGGDRILVTNGVYATGGRAGGTGDSDSRVFVNGRVTLLSVNGPQFTIIRGDQVMIPAPPWNWIPECRASVCVSDRRRGPVRFHAE